MVFNDLNLPGVCEIRIEPKSDERGFFARTWSPEELENHGLTARIAQCSISFNPRERTLRGMHYQAKPYSETKIVRCTRGSIYDVVVDLRPQSPTFKQWTAVSLLAEERNMLYVPEGCGHGFLTLEDNTEVFYQISQFHHAESARGVRWDDPAFRIAWPHLPEIMSERDRSYPNFE
jgi:dTDP-4-dehydrorhamnose 3,5-epimerase